MKKNISYALLSAALFTSIPAQASDATAPMKTSSTPGCGFSGFYLGGAVGYDLTEDKFLQTVKSSPDPDGGVSHKTALKGITGGVIAGWGKELPSRFYAGVELSYLFGKPKVTGLTDWSDDPSIDLKKKDTFAVEARLGITLNNIALPYIKLGYATSKFETTFEDTASESIKENKRLGGFSMGGGIDLKVSPRVLAGLSYTYVNYNSWNGNRHSVDSSPPPTPIDDDNYIKNDRKPKSHNILLRVAYTF